MYKELDAMNATSTNDANDQRSQGRKPLAVLASLFLSKRWWWGVAYVVFDGAVCVLFFGVFGGSFKIWCFLVCAIEKMVQLEEQNISQKTNKSHCW